MGIENLGITGYYGLNSNSGIVSNKNRTTRPPQDYVYVKKQDGTYAVMTKEEYLRYLIMVEIQKRYPQSVQSKVGIQPYELGYERNGVRIIDVNSVSEPQRPDSTAPKDNQCSPLKIQEYKNNIEIDNEIIDDFKQGKRGDCYLLSTIDSIRRTKDGQEILQNNVKKNSDGSYTVTLPGAINARNHYIEQGNGDKCAITGTYTITADAIEKAKELSGKSYAYGDLNVIIYELAMEAFRAEVVATNNALGQKSERYIAGQFGPVSNRDTLSGGQMYDAVYILTGQKSDVYEAPKSKRQNPKYYIPGQYGYVGEKNVKGRCLAASRDKGIVEVNYIYDKDSDLQKMLDKCKGHEEEYSITVGVYVGVNGPDGTTKKRGGHALTVTKITDSYVEVVNPWDSTKAERIPRGDFEQMAINLNVAPMSKDKIQKPVPVQEQSFIDQILNFNLFGLLNFMFKTT